MPIERRTQIRIRCDVCKTVILDWTELRRIRIPVAHHPDNPVAEIMCPRCIERIDADLEPDTELVKAILSID